MTWPCMNEFRRIRAGVTVTETARPAQVEEPMSSWRGTSSDETREAFAGIRVADLRRLAAASGTEPNPLGRLARALERGGYDTVDDTPEGWEPYADA